MTVAGLVPGCIDVHDVTSTALGPPQYCTFCSSFQSHHTQHKNPTYAVYIYPSCGCQPSMWPANPKSLMTGCSPPGRTFITRHQPVLRKVRTCIAAVGLWLAYHVWVYAYHGYQHGDAQ